MGNSTKLPKTSNRYCQHLGFINSFATMDTSQKNFSQSFTKTKLYRGFAHI